MLHTDGVRPYVAQMFSLITLGTRVKRSRLGKEIDNKCGTDKLIVKLYNISFLMRVRPRFTYGVFSDNIFTKPRRFTMYACTRRAYAVHDPCYSATFNQLTLIKLLH